jgi:NDP-sugar pyrophosphorylase family protein
MAERLVRQFAAAGVRRFTVLTAWLGEQVEAHFQGLTALPDGVTLDFPDEEWGLGTTGGLGALAPCSETVVFVFGDLVTDLDIRNLVAVHAVSGAHITLASHVETHRVRLGEIVADGAAVLGYREKPEKEFLICSGIAAFQPATVELIADLPRPVGLGDVVNAAVQQGQRVEHWRHGALWFDVNELTDIERAGAALRAAQVR